MTPNRSGADGIIADAVVTLVTPAAKSKNMPVINLAYKVGGREFQRYSVQGVKSWTKLEPGYYCMQSEVAPAVLAKLRKSL